MLPTWIHAYVCAVAKPETHHVSARCPLVAHIHLAAVVRVAHITRVTSGVLQAQSGCHWYT
jgi:hypothetical protein